MYILFTVLIVITCILTVLIVLVQNSKGGGLASNFASSNQVMGVRKTSDFLEKATWTLGAALILFSLVAGITMPKVKESDESRLEGKFDESQMNTAPTDQTINLPDNFNTGEESAPDGK